MRNLFLLPTKVASYEQFLQKNGKYLYISLISYKFEKKKV